MSKILIIKSEDEFKVVRENEDCIGVAFSAWGPSARALFAIFEELQVDGVAVIERAEPKSQTVGKLSYEIDIKTTLNGNPFPVDPLNNQDAVAADTVALVTDRLADVFSSGNYSDISSYLSEQLARAELGKELDSKIQKIAETIIERAEPKTKRINTIQSRDYLEGVRGWRISTEDGTIQMFSDKVSVSAQDAKAVFSGGPKPEPFSVSDDEVSIADAAIKSAAFVSADRFEIQPMEIGEAMAAPQHVTNICSQNNNYSSDALTKKQIRKLVRKEIAKESRPGGALWSPK